MADPILVDAAGAGELLSMSDRLVHELTNAGVLPSVDLGPGRDRRYSVDALRAWAVERSAVRLTELEEAGNGEAGKSGRRPAVPAGKRRPVGRGRPRQGRPEAVSLRLVSGRRDREA